MEGWLPMQQKSKMELLLCPRSIAIIGASDQNERLSSIPLKILVEGGYEGNIFPVNPGLDHIRGIECFNSAESLPEKPDVMFVVKTMPEAPREIKEGMSKNVPFIILGPGVWNNDIAKAVRSLRSRSLTRILGPDSLGFVNNKDHVSLACYPGDTEYFPKKGHIGLITQDGALGFSIRSSAQNKGLTFRYVVTTGADFDLDCLDIGEYLISDEGVNFLVFLFHELKEGRRFLDLVVRAKDAGIPVAVMHPNFFAVREHSMEGKTSFSSDRMSVWNSVLQQYGVINISGLDDLVDLGHMFCSYDSPCGNRVGILSTSMDAGALMREKCTDEGLLIPSFNCECPATFGGKNPFVLLPSCLDHVSGISSMLEWLFRNDRIDVVILVISFFMPDSKIWINLIDHIMDIFRLRLKPMACCWIPDSVSASDELATMVRNGIPIFSSFVGCARAISALCTNTRKFKSIPHIPFCLNLSDELPDKITEYHAKCLLSGYGATITSEKLCSDLEETIEAADMIGYPVALKVMSPNIVCKSQARIIALDLKNSEEVRNAYGRTLQRAVAANPDAEIIGVLVQEMLETGIECMIDVWRDPVFGPVVSVGLGGIYVEFLDDRSTRIAPVDTETATEMIKELKGVPILHGIWDQPGYSIDSLAEIVAKVSEILCVEDELYSISINPVFVREKDAVIVDAFMIRR